MMTLSFARLAVRTLTQHALSEAALHFSTQPLEVFFPFLHEVFVDVFKLLLMLQRHLLVASALALDDPFHSLELNLEKEMLLFEHLQVTLKDERLLLLLRRRRRRRVV